MGLNIKNERVCELAKQAAAATGRTQTSAIEAALEEFLARHRAAGAEEELSHRIDEIISDLQRRWQATDTPQALTTDDLYDENGLPA